MSRALMNKMGGGPMGGTMRFGKSNAKVYIASETGMKFTDVAGEDEAKENLMEVVDFLNQRSGLHNAKPVQPMDHNSGGLGAWNVRYADLQPVFHAKTP